MRSEKEMLHLILETARQDDRVRAVYINGSRANPNVKKDPYRDFDVVYVVTETLPFVEDPDWISVFGEIAIVQEPDRNDLFFGAKTDSTKSFTWLILFRDGNRIDLHVETVETMQASYGTDTLTVPLLDKDGILPSIPPSSDAGYFIRKPSENHFYASTNEFWWCLNNVAKGLVRCQLPYTMWMLECIVRPQLERMTEWYIGVQHDFQLTTGAHGKYFEKYLPEQLYAMYVKSYSDGAYAHIWDAVFTMCELFGILARAVAEALSYSYRADWEEGVLAYLRAMKNGEWNTAAADE